MILIDLSSKFYQGRQTIIDMPSSMVSVKHSVKRKMIMQHHLVMRRYETPLNIQKQHVLTKEMVRQQRKKRWRDRRRQENKDRRWNDE